MHEVLGAGWGNWAGSNHVLVTQLLWFSIWLLLMLGVKGVGRNHSHTICIMIGLCRDLLFPWCSVRQFLALLLFTAAAGAVFC